MGIDEINLRRARFQEELSKYLRTVQEYTEYVTDLIGQDEYTVKIQKTTDDMWDKSVEEVLNILRTTTERAAQYLKEREMIK
jgi:esterase/lipase